MMLTPFTPFLLFLYMVAAAGGLAVIGAVALILALFYFAILGMGAKPAAAGGDLVAASLSSSSGN